MIADDQALEYPEVSVVVPTLDRGARIRVCLEALRQQDHPGFEVIVVDDASSDATPTVLEETARQEPRIRLLRNDHHLGANPSRNRGVQAAKGGIVAFLDDDCVPCRDWLSALVTGFSNERVAAVSGLVEDAEPANIFELAFKGTHRVAGPGPARRLVGCNMAVRRDLLLELGWDEDRQTTPRTRDGRPDVSVSGRGDEEGLFVRLQALGYRIEAVPDAVVLHEHRFTGWSYFRQALRGGRSAARFVYKYRLPTRLDVAPFILAWLSSPLVLVRSWLAVVPPLFFAAAIGAITYNDLALKGKTPRETIRSFPVLLAYYHVRVVGYVLEAIRLRLGAGGEIQRVDLRGIDSRRASG